MTHVSQTAPEKWSRFTAPVSEACVMCIRLKPTNPIG